MPPVVHTQVVLVVRSSLRRVVPAVRFIPTGRCGPRQRTRRRGVKPVGYQRVWARTRDGTVSIRGGRLSTAGSPGPPPSTDPDELSRLRAENEHLQEEVSTLRAATPRSRRSIGNRIRRVATPVLVILTSLTLVAATLGV